MGQIPDDLEIQMQDLQTRCDYLREEVYKCRLQLNQIIILKNHAAFMEQNLECFPLKMPIAANYALIIPEEDNGS